MSAAFADTFYWIALTFPLDAAHERASQFSSEIVTTDEVLIEYLNFFSRAAEYLRRDVAMAVEATLQDPDVRVVPQSRDSFRAGLDIPRPARQGLRPDGLHFDADHAEGRAD